MYRCLNNSQKDCDGCMMCREPQEREIGMKIYKYTGYAKCRVSGWVEADDEDQALDMIEMGNVLEYEVDETMEEDGIDVIDITYTEEN